METEKEYKEKQQKWKEQVGEKVAKAKEKRGVWYVVTGDGKGKSTAAFGTAFRAVGHGQKVVVCQFIKGKWPSGERKILESLGVDFHVMETGFTWNTQDREADAKAAKRTWEAVAPAFSDTSIDLVVLDELTYMLNYEYLDADEVLKTIAARPEKQHVIVTGRNASDNLIALADTVSEVKNQKHAFEAGVQAQKGFDF